MENEHNLVEVQESDKAKGEGYYVQIPLKIFAFGNDCFMTNDELIVYYMLCTMISARNVQKVECNIELLFSKLNFGYFGFKEDSKNKNEIRKALSGLHEKGYIVLSYYDSEIKYHTYLDIFIPKINPKEKERGQYYLDENGKPKQETNSYSVVSVEGNRILHELFYRLACRQINVTRGKDSKPKNPYYYEYFQQKLEAGKTKKQAIICMMRKLVDVIFAMIKNRTEYVKPVVVSKLAG